MYKVTIVIVNYYSQKIVSRCLHSLRALNRDDLNYVVVDNSEQPDMAALKSLHPSALLLRPGTNLGFGGGSNMGILHALKNEIPYILLLNPDIRIEKDFISPLLDAMETDHKLGMAGPCIVEDAKGRDLWQGIGSINWWLGGPKQRWYKNLTRPEKPVFVPFLSGCAMLLRSEAVSQVGLMEDKYFLYFEDIDYSQAFLRAGWKLAFIPSAEVFHASSSTVGRHSELQVYQLSRNRLWFLQRWAHWYQYFFFMAYNTLVKIPGVVLLFGLVWRRPKLIHAYLKGYRDGLQPFSNQRQITKKKNQ